MSEDLSVLYEDYLASQLAGDRRAALRVVLDRGAGRGVPVPDLYLDVIQRAQHRIGYLWQTNQVTVAQEHLATSISYLALAQLYPALPRQAETGKRAIVACVAGELHDLGARMTADFFEMAGFDVIYLGANVPTDSLIGMVREIGPDLAVLSTMMTFHLDSLRGTIEDLRSALGNRIRIAIGGHAFDWAPSLPAQLAVDVFGHDARESVTRAQGLFGLTEAA